MIRFKVESSWLEENDIDPASIVMLRFADDKWNELETIMLDEYNSYVNYKAISPGMSNFAVTVQSEDGYTEEEVQEETTEVTEELTARSEQNETEQETGVEEITGAVTAEDSVKPKRNYKVFLGTAVLIGLLVGMYYWFEKIKNY